MRSSALAALKAKHAPVDEVAEDGRQLIRVGHEAPRNDLALACAEVGPREELCPPAHFALAVLFEVTWLHVGPPFRFYGGCLPRAERLAIGRFQSRALYRRVAAASLRRYASCSSVSFCSRFGRGVLPQT